MIIISDIVLWGVFTTVRNKVRILVLLGCYPKKMNGKEEEIYNILYKKKEINDKTPKLRTEDEKKKLKNKWEPALGARS